MSLAVEFSKQIVAALEALPEDEWAVVSLRERVVEGVDSPTAFENVVDFVNLAQMQSDAYAFESCLWVAAALAERSNTTERPLGLAEAVAQTLAAPIPVGGEAAIRWVANWYRIHVPAN